MVTTYEAGNYDVVVVGAGHAGSEAALASARMGAKTLLLTMNLEMVAFMPCNPSVGGPAKGVVVREIDALGGEMGRNIDKTYIQMRMLNTGKGPAVRALRAQADKHLYAQEMKKTIEKQENLDLRQGIAEELIVEDGVCKGVITNTGAIYRSKAVVLTAGTSSRVKGSSIDYSKTEIQPGDDTPNLFSFTSKDEDYRYDQIPCWLTYTNEGTHETIRENLHRAPMFTGIVEGVGARYCPSIEDKIVRFSDKPRHQIFLEPEGENTEAVYIQGLSTSLPEDVQIKMIRSVEGLENAEMMRTGYAIEYDVVVPHQLKNTFETKLVQNLFTAGQMNGTSGYEEAAGQGLYAGINAVRKIRGEEPFILGRSDAYIGVLVDDLVTKGTTEPYRLLTSRAEYRLLLRHDNADLRLTEKGRELGLIDDERYAAFQAKQEAIEAEIKRMQSIRLKPTAQLQAFLAEKGSAELKDGILLSDLLKRPELSYDELVGFAGETVEVSREVKEQVEISIKYEGYIAKAIEKVEKLKRMEAKRIPANIDYDAINGLATEARQRLKLIQPETIAQASRISGVNPADVSILMVYIEQGKIAKVQE